MTAAAFRVSPARVRTVATVRDDPVIEARIGSMRVRTWAGLYFVRVGCAFELTTCPLTCYMIDMAIGDD